MPTYFAQVPSNHLQCESGKNYDNTEGRDGCYRLNKDQLYEGEFFRDTFHGEGTYKWFDSGVAYEGGFYSNFREGYASLSFPDNSYFEGLFVGNRPFGPGIFTYANGRQDAGFWLGKKLVRLSRAVDFIIPRLAPTSAGKIKLLQFRRLIQVEEDDHSAVNILRKYEHPLESFPDPYARLIYDRRSVFFDREAFHKAYFAPYQARPLEFPCTSPCVRLSADLEETADDEVEEKPIPPHCLCPNDVLVMRYDSLEEVDVCDVESKSLSEERMGILAYFTKYGTEGRLDGEMEKKGSELLLGESADENDEKRMKDTSKIPKIISWNRSELCTEMLKQIFRFRDFEGKLNFNLSKLMVGARTAFRKTGENEKQCLHFLKMCSLGPAHEVKSLLCSYDISEELMDARGNNSLMFAAATDQHDVIDVLLNYGVDMNTFNDEGLTPLNLCLLRRLAQANGISNWETAFLPKETYENEEVESQTREYPLRESISSLDRIFGDGMSVAESNVLGLESYLSPVESPAQVAPFYERKQSCEQDKRVSRNCLSTNGGSKSLGSFAVLNWDWDCRKKTSLLSLSNPTPILNIKIIPKSVKRDEFQKSVQKTSRDKYFFELNFDNTTRREQSLNFVKKRNTKRVDNEENWEGEGQEEKEYDVNCDLELTERISKIDKTIAILLSRGADPNASEVPKPSIHLAIYTKDFKTVHSLLSHGADPDSVLHSNEGLLTPLHVITLRESAPEYIDLCELLLNFKANPDKTTLPEFALSEEEKQHLDPECGRTPLQLLCMRPDLEFTDRNGNLIKIGLLLARVCQRKLLYNGHSYLTLAMLSGNVKLLEALLYSRFFDPKAILGKSRGTCLHVLVSSELQRKTPYETSIKMAKLLIRAGADPLKRFKHPKSLRGTCVDYGKREIEAEKKARKFASENPDAKQSEKYRKQEERDYLKDHQRVVDFLSKMAAHAAKKEASAKQQKHLGNLSHRIMKERPFSEKAKRHGKGTAESAKERYEQSGGVGTEEKGNEENTNGEFAEDRDEDGGAGVVEKRKSFNQEGKGKRRSAQGSLDADDLGKSSKNILTKQNDAENDAGDAEGNNQVRLETSGEKTSVPGKTRKDAKGVSRVIEDSREGRFRKTKTKRGRLSEGEGQEGANTAEYFLKGKSKKGTDDVRTARIKKGEERIPGKKEKAHSEDRDAKKGKKKAGREKKEAEERKERGKQTGPGKLIKAGLKVNAAESNVPKEGRSRLAPQNINAMRMNTPEVFPEKLRQIFLRLYGSCVSMDINEFLMPYVVLRDGELYYKFKRGATKQKEQYSLV